MILKDICHVDWGNISLTKSSYVNDGEFLAVSAAGCDGKINHYEHEANVSVLSAIGSQCGKMFYPNTRFTAIKNTITLTPKNNALGKFIYYLFLAVDLPKRGAGQPFISKGDIEKFKIPDIPTLENQEKIVKTLDVIFVEIEKVVLATETVIENTEILFQSYLTQVFMCVSNNWIESLTGDVCLNITDGKHGDCVDEQDSGYYFLSAKDIKNGVINYSDTRQITKEDFEETHRRTNLECGDVLITNSGTIGRMAIVEDNDKTKKTTFQKSVAILKPKVSMINSKFLFHLLTSKLSHFNKISAGAAQKNLLLRDIRSLKINYPKDLSEQLKISKNCDMMRDTTIKLINSYVIKRKELNLLRQSILKKIFNGKLAEEF